MFEPTDEETAMSPKPFRATITLVIKSGIEVPAAKNVSPIIYGVFNNKKLSFTILSNSCPFLQNEKKAKHVAAPKQKIYWEKIPKKVPASWMYSLNKQKF